MDLNLEIITPQKILYSADVGLIQLPGINGSFTVLKNHAAIVSKLVKGKIRVIGKDGKESFFNCANGIFECKNNKATILLDSYKI
ncbi:F0F1 ATP synthase subunit epsilon [Plebeiibacterium marinum]|uniref:F0F1 ATP synthase subunit epsilon n=1 Tax=Plebeiibacterium marinum TaxID=2992111 RepID=A0AAE3MG46_9BACT|nr:F0F1 ATP synthase subunit epsilon [Plebeiobacterium marinum]MCW3806402.1 F0F1 ATP synthase subunit epsilon [Plebeiobacterium marinum]